MKSGTQPLFALPRYDCARTAPASPHTPQLPDAPLSLKRFTIFLIGCILVRMLVHVHVCSCLIRVSVGVSSKFWCTCRCAHRPYGVAELSTG